jgi:phage terminase large subunit
VGLFVPRPDMFTMSELPPPAAPDVVDMHIPQVFAPFLKKSRIKGAWGGRGSSKSHTFARLLILRCLNQPGTRWICVREVQKALSQSVKQLLVDVIKHLRVSSHFRVLRNEIVTPGGGLLVFVGMNEVTKDNVKSFEGFDGAWVEEAQTFSQTSLDLLRPTLRKEGSEIWFSWNPTNATDPVDKFLRGDVLPPDAIVVKALWSDNPWFPQVLRTDMEWDRGRDFEKYEHVWGGEYEKNSEARIYKNWVVDHFDTPEDAAFLFGSDWGYAVDPSTLIRCYLVGRRLYVDFESYKVGCEIDDTPYLFDLVGCSATGCQVRAWLEMDRASRPQEPPTCEAPGHGMARRWKIVGDSARPETISYLKRNGYAKLEPSIKGPNSVDEGIEFLQTYDIVVHPRCVNTIDELKSYKYKTDPNTGAILPVPRDKKNHVMDALRYCVEHLRRSRKKGGLVYAGATR